MTKCLITKLNGTVSDKTLLKIGEIKFKLTATKINSYLSLAVDDYATKTKVTFDVPVLYGTGASSQEVSVKTQITEVLMQPGYIYHFFAVNNNAVINCTISDKYHLKTFATSEGTAGGFLISELRGFSYLTSLKTINTRGGAMDIDSNFVGMKSLEEIYVTSKSYSDLDVLSDITTLKTVVLQSSQITGTPSKLSALKVLKILNLQSSSISENILFIANNINLRELVVSGTKATGTIESLAQAQVNAGRKSENLTVYSAYSEVTYNGSTFDYLTIKFSESGYTVQIGG